MAFDVQNLPGEGRGKAGDIALELDKVALAPTVLLFGGKKFRRCFRNGDTIRTSAVRLW
jgi:hypothetical protein